MYFVGSLDFMSLPLTPFHFSSVLSHSVFCQGTLLGPLDEAGLAFFEPELGRFGGAVKKDPLQEQLRRFSFLLKSQSKSMSDFWRWSPQWTKTVWKSRQKHRKSTEKTNRLTSLLHRTTKTSEHRTSSQVLARYVQDRTGGGWSWPFCWLGSTLWGYAAIPRSRSFTKQVGIPKTSKTKLFFSRSGSILCCMNEAII